MALYISLTFALHIGCPSKTNINGDEQIAAMLVCIIFEHYLSYGVVSWSEITPCIKIDKPLVVYRFSGNVMTSIKTLRT